MGFDHKVPWRSDEDIEATANAVLQAVGGYDFNVMNLLRKRYIGQSFGKAGQLVLKIIPPQSKKKRPFVRFAPFELHLTQQLINAGDRNLPEARHILAHELGHIVMHRAHSNFFSTGSAVKLNFLKREESSECQAHCFAGFVLLPDKFFLEQTVNIEHDCIVPNDLLADRQRKFTNRIEEGYYTPRNCLCGAFMARRRGLLLKCCGCGFEEQL